MSKEEKYRRLADECLMEANRSDSGRTRAILFNMAEEWLRLALQEAEQQLAAVQEHRKGEPSPPGSGQDDA
jgi:hypothetical protein